VGLVRRTPLQALVPGGDVFGSGSLDTERAIAMVHRTYGNVTHRELVARNERPVAQVLIQPLPEGLETVHGRVDLRLIPPVGLGSHEAPEDGPHIRQEGRLLPVHPLLGYGTLLAMVYLVLIVIFITTLMSVVKRWMQRPY